MSIDFNTTTPIYIQIMNLVKRDIATGKLKEGEKLPSVRDMSENIKVNPNTVQRAYQELEREKITFTQRGMGTFVVEDENKIKILKKELAQEVVVAFINGMRNIGFTNEEMIIVLKDYINGGKN